MMILKAIGDRSKGQPTAASVALQLVLGEEELAYRALQRGLRVSVEEVAQRGTLVARVFALPLATDITAHSSQCQRTQAVSSSWRCRSSSCILITTFERKGSILGLYSTSDSFPFS